MLCHWCRIAVAVMLILPLGSLAQRAQEPAPKLNSAKLQAEAIIWLVDLLRINTVNPPGNELAGAKYLAGILEREGITAEVLESAPGRGIVVARLRASVVPDPSKALLLLGHIDTVGVQKERWSFDPFGGVINDGYLYGRGAIDDKGMVIANLATIIGLKRAGVRLDRDVIFLAEADEEEAGDYGIDFAINKHWDKIAAGFALNEGGRIKVQDGKVEYVGIQASEKIPVNVQVVATGPSGHASMPRKDNPVLHLAAAVAKIGAYQPPAKPNTITRRYFESLARIVDPETSKWMRALETPDRMEHAARVLSDGNPMWNSMLRNSIAPTMLSAGIRTNVVPSEARATLNIRLLPGESIDAVIADLSKAVDDPQIRFEIQPASRQPAPPSLMESSLYQTIERKSLEAFPGAVVLPFMSTGATDSSQLRRHNVQAYGLLPFPLRDEDDRRMHADNERIPLDSFRKGLDFLYRVVEDFVKAK